MTIQNPTIAAGSTLTRSQAETVVAVLSDAVPPNGYVVAVDGELQFYFQEAEREGQIAFVQDSNLTSVDMYVVVSINSILEWRKITRTGVITDPRSGEPKDPLFDFYSELS